MRLGIQRIAALLASSTLVLGVVNVPSGAQSNAAGNSPTYTVTFAARVCPTYESVFANRSRNNIQESLKNLGPDTPYANFTQVLPSFEDGLSPQNNCQPLTGWKFALGSGYTRPVPGTNLSYVTGTSSVADRQVTTLASTPLLDAHGDPTGSAIPGAATITLTAAEANLASRSSSLWTMGGTPTQPLGSTPNDYGFAALRCATDNVNGDNVEWIGFPSATTHVFCFAFYVQPPPGAGTITITKQLASAQAGAASFDFQGSISYTSNNDFQLTVPGGQTTKSINFVRGETRPSDAPWTVEEQPAPGYDLTSLVCNKLTTSVITISGAEASIVLAPGDHVTCTYLNSLTPPLLGKLSITKTVTSPAGFAPPSSELPETFTYAAQSGANHANFSTTVPYGQTSSPTATALVIAGTWQVSEDTPPIHAGWTWTPSGVTCVDDHGHVTTSATASISVPVSPTDGASCIFTNVLHPTGSLTILVKSHGATGSFPVHIVGLDALAGTELNQTATTTSDGVATIALGDSTTPLNGSWNVSVATPNATSRGHWRILGSPSCNVRGPAAHLSGPEELRVSPSNSVQPNLVCDFEYQFVPASTVSLEKVVLGDLSAFTSNVVITLTCDDGSTATLTVPPGTTNVATLPTPVVIQSTTTCHAVETESGVNSVDSVAIVHGVMVNGAYTSEHVADFVVPADTTSSHVVAVFANTFSKGGGNNGGGGTDGKPPTNGGSGDLPYTGAPLQLLGGLAVVLGGLSVFAFLRRRSILKS